MHRRSYISAREMYIPRAEIYIPPAEMCIPAREMKATPYGRTFPNHTNHLSRISPTTSIRIPSPQASDGIRPPHAAEAFRE
ncbi:hypothetical protein Q3C19_06350 [Bacteroides sp. ET489]|uniref:hypothetical protein n=1 Tax=Bacteroides sp. ET489 TaxID=3057126 RepID=UPI002671B250|nr:hypothetical protein [Bacteroides sp. ET489]MDO3390094.1 hypothetical protein [Bacteroides sp. ET489]